MSGIMCKGSNGPSKFENQVMSLCKTYMQSIAEKYGVDEDEILIGVSRIPPSDQTYLVYICLNSFKPLEYTRKNKNGRWVLN
jgi:hypothetical protein